MPHMLCYKLIRLAGGVVCHGFQKTTDRFLVEWRDASVLINQFFLSRSKQLPKGSRSPSCQHKTRVHTMFFKCRHIAKVERIRSKFIIFLGPPTDAKKLTKLCLI